MAPNDPSAGWEGNYRGTVMGPAVLVYYEEVLFIDGETQVYKWDVMVVR